MDNTNNKFLNDENLKVVWENIHERFVRKKQLTELNELNTANLKKISEGAEYYGDIYDNPVYITQNEFEKISEYLKSINHKLLIDGNYTYIKIGDCFRDGKGDEIMESQFIYSGLFLRLDNNSVIYYLKITYDASIDINYPYLIIFKSYIETDTPITDRKIKDLCKQILI